MNENSSRTDGLRRLSAALWNCGLPMSALAIAAAMTAVNIAVLLATGHKLNLPQFAGFIALWIVLMGVACRLALSGQRFGAALIGSLAILLVNLSSGALHAALGMTLGFPLVDRQLAAIDAMAGIDHQALIAWMAARPRLGAVLMQCYDLSVQMIPAVCCALVATGQYERLRLLLIGFSATLAVTVLAATLLPAVGTYVHLDLRAVAPTGLPTGSGDYHLDNFHIARSGAQLVLGPLNISGVVTFPSFHAVMALLVSWGCWRTPWLRWPALAYGLATLFATVPLGGHYVIDLVAGGLLLAAVLLLARAPAAEPQRQPMLAPAE